MTIPEGFYFAAVRYGPNPSLPNGAEWTFGGETSAGLTVPAVIATAIRDIIAGTAIESTMADHVGISEVYVKVGPDATGPSATVAASINGTTASQGVPANSAVLVRKLTALGGRRGRGRMFVPGITESQVDNGGVLATGIQAEWQAVFTQIRTNLEAGSLPMMLLHDPATQWVLVNGQPRRVDIAGAIPPPTPIVSLFVEPELATQRRRLRS